jgi:LmbE family N-acetylglucosaminyl deacetylase
LKSEPRTLPRTSHQSAPAADFYRNIGFKRMTRIFAKALFREHVLQIAFWCAAAVIAAIVCTRLIRAQTPSSDAIQIAPDRGAPGMSRWLHALQTRASLVLVTAHPDDEDGGMLAFESRGQGARASLLTLNRGEGGQNVMGPDLYDALGLVRTQELLSADRYMGVDQYFTRAIDFGFSKTREEALQEWDHDRVLSDVVRVIRMTRPLVIASVFVGAATDGHGHHQVAGQMAQEAYLAAGDPARFPEQIKEGLRPWSPLKVYERVPNFAITKEGMYDYAIDKYVPVRFFDYIAQTWSTERPSVTLEIPEGVPAPASGLTYLQIAREGLGLQKTQNGGGVTPPAAPQNSAYHRYGSRVKASDKENSFFDGIDTSLVGIADLAPGQNQFLKDGLTAISRLAADAARQYSIEKPTAIAPILADGLKATRNLIAEVNSSSLAEPSKSDVLFELGVKEDQFQKALATSLDLALETTVAAERPAGAGRGTAPAITAPAPPPFPGQGRGGPTFTIAIPGQSFAVETRIYNETPEALKVESVEVVPSDGKNWNIRPTGDQPHEVTPGKDQQWRFSVTVPADATFTRPYFSRPNEEQPYYDLDDPRYRNLPLAPYPLAAKARLSYNGTPFEIAEYVQTSERVSGIGTLPNPLLVGPAISVTVSPSAGAVPLSSKSFNFTVTVHSNEKGSAQGVLRLKLPQGWRSTPSEAPFSLARDGEDQTIVFSVSPDLVKPAEYTITAEADYKGRTYVEGYRMTGYPGVRPYPFYRPATYRAVGVDVTTAPGLRIGFIPGTGDDVPKALENLGQNVRTLSDTDITQGDLSGYDAIILGVRAYAVRSDIKAANSRLLDYVKNGGVLIVQYNLQGFESSFGPYPLNLGNNSQKVIDETSPVVLDRASPVFAWPNKVTADDFKGWVEERGHGFMQTWDPRYQSLIETHDPEQDPQKGGLLLARYGKGFYVYDALALYRQLPAGVPGAFRLLANLVSLSKNPSWN